MAAHAGEFFAYRKAEVPPFLGRGIIQKRLFAQKMKLLSFCLMATSAFGWVSQYCAGFEYSKNSRELVVQVNSDSSVLLYNITDVTSSNIPFTIDDEILQLEPNGFGVCTQEKASQDLCDAVEGFSLQLDGAHQHLINQFIRAGDQVSLRISEESVYCAVIYQKGTELNHPDLVEKHSYGYLPLQQYGVLHVFCLLNFLLTMTFVAFMIMYKIEKRECIRNIYKDIFSLLAVKGFLSSTKYLLLDQDNSYGSHRWMRYLDISSLNDIIASSLYFSIYYKLSVGVFGSHKKNVDKTKMVPLFKYCLLLMIFSRIMVSFQPTLEKILPFQLFVLTRMISEIVVFAVWIPMIYILWKNSNLTEREIENPIFVKKYNRSKICLFCIPISTFFVSFAGTMVVMNAISGSVYSHSDELSDDMQKVSFLLLESSVNQNFSFLLLKHLSEFSMLFAQWALLFIWRPFLNERTDFENAQESKMEVLLERELSNHI